MNRARDRLILVSGWITLFLMGTDIFVLSPLLPLIAERFAVSVARAGWGMSVFAFAYAVLAPFFGRWGDRHGRRGPLTAGLLVFGAANAATAAAPTFGAFLAARLVAGGAAAAITPTIYAVTGDLAPAARRGAWLAIVGSGLFTALWSSAPLGALLGYRVGWQEVFALLALVPVVLSLVEFLAVPAHLRGAGAPARETSALIRDVSLTSLWGAALYATYTYLGAGLRAVAHATPRQIAVAIAVYGVGMVLGGLSGGHAADRWGSRRAASASCLLLAFFVLLFGALASRWVPALAALFAFALSAALFFPAFQAFLAHHHPERRGAALAWNNSALYFGITIGSFLGGAALSRWGFRSVAVLSAAFAVAAFFWDQRLQAGE